MRLLPIVVLLACVTPKGADLWVDLDKHDLNYADFPTEQLVVGADESVLREIGRGRTVEAGDGYRVLAFDKWVSTSGPDYVVERLFVRVNGGRIANWRVERVTTDAVLR